MAQWVKRRQGVTRLKDVFVGGSWCSCLACKACRDAPAAKPRPPKPTSLGFFCPPGASSPMLTLTHLHSRQSLPRSHSFSTPWYPHSVYRSWDRSQKSRLQYTGRTTGGGRESVRWPCVALSACAGGGLYGLALQLCWQGGVPEADDSANMPCPTPHPPPAPPVGHHLVVVGGVADDLVP